MFIPMLLLFSFGIVLIGYGIKFIKSKKTLPCIICSVLGIASVVIAVILALPN